MIRMVGLVSEFFDFLKDYKVVDLAVAFIMGVTATSLVKSLVDNMIMPWVNILVTSGDWKTAVIALGPVKLGIGPFTAECINFIVIAFVAFPDCKICNFHFGHIILSITKPSNRVKYLDI